MGARESNEIFLGVFEHSAARVLFGGWGGGGGGGGGLLAKNRERVVCTILCCYESKVMKDSFLCKKTVLEQV